MIWTKLKIRNYMSIKSIDLDLNNRGLTLIEGKNKSNEAYLSNGSGKSSMLSSIVYAIYDQTDKGIRADDVVNNTEGKNTSVILEGIKGENTYRIERYRKHSKHKNKVLLFKDDVEITQKSTRDTNALIESIVGIDFNTFMNSIFFSQGVGGGKFTSATDAEKKKILEDVVNLNIYGVAQELAKDKIKNKQTKLDTIHRDIKKLQWDLDNVANKEKQDEDNYQHTKNMIKEEQDNIGTQTENMATYARDNFHIVEGYRRELEELQEKINDTNNIDVTEEYEVLVELERQHRDLINQKNVTEAEKDRMVQAYKQVSQGTNCPTCGAEMDNAHRETEMASLREQVKVLLIKQQEIEKQITPIQESYESAKQNYDRVRKVQEQGNELFRQLKQQYDEKQQLIANYETTLQRYKDDIQRSKDTLERLYEVPQPRPRDDERVIIQEDIKVSKSNAMSVQKDINNLEDVVKIYSNSGVKSHILDLVTPYLNERANKYLKRLSGSDIEIVFSTQTRNKSGELTDKFDVQVNNSTGGSTYKSNSEGEKKRIDLAISLAIQDLVISRSKLSTNLIMYDEVFDALDEVGSEQVVELLRDRLEIIPSIFVITHSEHLKNLFENVITVTKNKKGETTIEEEKTV